MPESVNSVGCMMRLARREVLRGHRISTAGRRRSSQSRVPELSSLPGRRILRRETPSAPGGSHPAMRLPQVTAPAQTQASLIGGVRMNLSLPGACRYVSIPYRRWACGYSSSRSPGWPNPAHKRHVGSRGDQDLSGPGIGGTDRLLSAASLSSRRVNPQRGRTSGSPALPASASSAQIPPPGH